MTVESIAQLGFAAGIATYLVIFLVKDVKTTQNKMLETLACILEALDVKRKK